MPLSMGNIRAQIVILEAGLLSKTFAKEDSGYCNSNSLPAWHTLNINIPEIISERIGLIYFQQNKVLLENISEMELCLFLLIKHFSLKLLLKKIMNWFYQNRIFISTLKINLKYSVFLFTLFHDLSVVKNVMLYPT